MDQTQFNEGYFDGKTSNYRWGYIYDDVKKSMYTYYLTLLKKVLPDTKRFLDVGCALGFFVTEASTIFEETYGVDISDFAISYAKAHEKGDFLCVDILQFGLPYKDNFFSCIASLEVVEHMKDDTTYFEEIYRVLEPTGILLLSTPIRNSFLRKLIDKDPTHINLHDPQYYVDRLEKLGFEVLTIKKIFTWRFPPFYWMRNMLHMKAHPIFSSFSNTSQGIFLIARKK